MAGDERVVRLLGCSTRPFQKEVPGWQRESSPEAWTSRHDEDIAVPSSEMIDGHWPEELAKVNPATVCTATLVFRLERMGVRSTLCVSLPPLAALVEGSDQGRRALASWHR